MMMLINIMWKAQFWEFYSWSFDVISLYKAHNKTFVGLLFI